MLWRRPVRWKRASKWVATRCGPDWSVRRSSRRPRLSPRELCNWRSSPAIGDEELCNQSISNTISTIVPSINPQVSATTPACVVQSPPLTSSFSSHHHSSGNSSLPCTLLHCLHLSHCTHVHARHLSALFLVSSSSRATPRALEAAPDTPRPCFASKWSTAVTL